MRHLLQGRSRSAFLFDLDGTLLNSLQASRRVWTRWATRFGLDGAAILDRSHGMKVEDVVAGLKLPGVDPKVEAAVISNEELGDLDGVHPIRGAAEFLASLPRDRWAIVTSAPRALAERRLAAARLPGSDVLVCAEDVMRGKPQPECFMSAARRLGVAALDCVVFEDAPAGIAAGRAAGAAVISVVAAHPGDPAAAADAILDYSELRICPAEPGRWTLADGTVAP